MEEKQASTNQTVTVNFIPDGLVVEAPAGTALIEILDASGADMTFGCRRGTCGTCRINVVEGSQNVSPPSREEQDFLSLLKRPATERLACQVNILDDVTLDYPER